MLSAVWGKSQIFKCAGLDKAEIMTNIAYRTNSSPLAKHRKLPLLRQISCMVSGAISEASLHFLYDRQPLQQNVKQSPSCDPKI